MPYDLLSKQIERCAVVVEVNAALAGMYGLRREQMIGRPVVEFAPNCGIQMADLTKTDEYRIAEREEMEVSVEGNPVYIVESYKGIIEDRMLKRVWGVQRNITDRKLAEKELDISRNRLSRAEIISRSGNWEFDLKSKRVFASDGARKIYGLLNTEWTIAEVQKLPLPQYREMLDRALQNLVKENRPYDVEFKIRRPDTGETIDIHSIAEYDCHRDVVFGIIQDITEEKQTEEKLNHERQKFAILSEHAPLGMALIDNNGQFLYINPKFRDIFGYDLSDIPDGKTWFKKVYPDETYRHNVISAWLDDVNNTGYGEQQPRVFNTTCKNGSTKVINFIPVLLGNNANIMTCEDITERKRLEMQLVHAQKMEAIGTLAGGIAHDFNNLLMGIQGYASLTLLDLDPSHPHYERLKRIEEQVQSGADLTKQLLGFARGGKYEAKPSDINHILEDTSYMFGRTKKEISIHRKYGKNLHAVEVDRGQIEQVFMNLYVNAWQAMPGGGVIYLETENVLLDYKRAFSYSVKPGLYIRISMTDTGTGMDEKTKERIFDPFFTTKEMGRGTGLGLAMVYGIIKGHGGIINVHSKAGQGTTFNIYLPASEKEVIKEKTATETITRGTETILLVDDEKMVLEATKALLESIGYSVYTAGSGQEAIAVYTEKRKEIDMVLLDMIMPGTSGGDTFDRLKEIERDIKVVLSSGYSVNDQAQQILDRGCNGFLQKPFRIEILSAKIREILD